MKTFKQHITEEEINEGIIASILAGVIGTGLGLLIADMTIYKVMDGTGKGDYAGGSFWKSVASDWKAGRWFPALKTMVLEPLKRRSDTKAKMAEAAKILAYIKDDPEIEEFLKKSMRSHGAAFIRGQRAKFKEMLKTKLTPQQNARINEITDQLRDTYAQHLADERRRMKKQNVKEAKLSYDEYMKGRKDPEEMTDEELKSWLKPGRGTGYHGAKEWRKRIRYEMKRRGIKEAFWPSYGYDPRTGKVGYGLSSGVPGITHSLHPLLEPSKKSNTSKKSTTAKKELSAKELEWAKARAKRDARAVAKRKAEKLKQKAGIKEEYVEEESFVDIYHSPLGTSGTHKLVKKKVPRKEVNAHLKQLAKKHGADTQDFEWYKHGTKP